MKKIMALILLVVIIWTIDAEEKGERNIEVYPLIDRPVSMGVEVNYYIMKNEKNRIWTFFHGVGFERGEKEFEGEILEKEYRDSGMNMRGGIRKRWYFNREETLTASLFFDALLYRRNDIEEKRADNRYIKEIKADLVYKNIKKIYGENRIDGREAGVTLAVEPGGKYERMTVNLKEFITLYSTKGFNVILGSRLIGDFLYGEKISPDEMRKIGGIKVKNGIGGSVRGIEGGKYPSTKKIIYNQDLRMSFPWGVSEDIMPMTVIFFDAAAGDEGKILKTSGVMTGITLRPYYMEWLFGERMELMAGGGYNEKGARVFLFDIGVHF